MGFELAVAKDVDVDGERGRAICFYIFLGGVFLWWGGLRVQGGLEEEGVRGEKRTGAGRKGGRWKDK